MVTTDECNLELLVYPSCERIVINPSSSYYHVHGIIQDCYVQVLDFAIDIEWNASGKNSLKFEAVKFVAEKH